MSDYTIVTGDAREALRAMQPESIDAVVTDPPYGIRFMGKRWDYDVPSVAAFAEMRRVLKAGGRLLCFASARTMHRMWVNIEDAGFTIEDTIAWLYGSGFPKHRSKLKPAYEPICVARRGPVSALGIEACRVGTARAGLGGAPSTGYSGGLDTAEAGGRPVEGRYPANVVLDEEAARVLDGQSGESTGSDRVRQNGPDRGAVKFTSAPGGVRESFGYADTGGASRFFYTAKASRSEREAGLEGVELRPGGSTASGFTDDVGRGVDRTRPVANPHPTVKPVDLMSWLVRLVAEPGDTVLDPFCGSGTTGVACTLEGVHFVGIEREPEYAEIARRRIYQTQPSLFAPTGGGDAA